MSGIKKMTPAEMQIVRELYESGMTNLRLLQLHINKLRYDNGQELIKSCNTIKNYLKQESIYVAKPVGVKHKPANLTLIKIPHKIQLQWVNEKKWTYPTIRKALRGLCDNEMAMQIRKAAMESGGVEYTKVARYPPSPSPDRPSVDGQTLKGGKKAPRALRCSGAFFFQRAFPFVSVG